MAPSIGEMTLKELLDEVGKDPANVRKRASKEFAEGSICKERLETLSCVIMLHGPIDRDILDFFSELGKKCVKGPNNAMVFRAVKAPLLLLKEVEVTESYLRQVEGDAKRLLHLYLGMGQVSGKDRKAIALALVFLADFAGEYRFTQRFVCHYGGKSEGPVRDRSKEILYRLSRYIDPEKGREYDLSRPKDVTAARELLRKLLARHDELVKQPCAGLE